MFLAVLGETAVRDYKTRTIPNSRHFILFLLGLAGIWIFPERGFLDKCIGACAVSLPMLIITFLIPGAFGGGDIKLMVACGWLLGVKSVVNAAIIAVFASGVYCILMLLMKKLKRKDEFAFGPWLVLGLYVSVFYREFLLNLLR